MQQKQISVLPVDRWEEQRESSRVGIMKIHNCYELTNVKTRQVVYFRYTKFIVCHL